jgi:hypothetical protein
MEKFKYTNSVQVRNWGCSFDSLLELKYVISIQDDYEFLRAQIPIYYDLKTRTPTNYIRECTRRYTPDFLIRHKQTYKAVLVEIKPRAFENDKQLSLRKEVAEKYIRWKSFDWSFRIVYDDEIILTSEQEQIFQNFCRLIFNGFRKKRFQLSDNKFEGSKSLFLKTTPGNKQVRFIMFGP